MQPPVRRPPPMPQARPAAAIVAGPSRQAAGVQGDLFAPKVAAMAHARPQAPSAPARRGFASLSPGRQEDVAGAPPMAARPLEPQFAEIKGKVSRVIFEAPDGFTVYLVRQDGGGEAKVAASAGAKASKGERIVAKGKWSTYRGQPTFRAALVVHDIPKGARGVVTWLKTKAAPGVGKATAEKLAKHFGDVLPKVVGDAEELAKAGIPKDKAVAIADAWNSNASQPELVERLGRFGLGEMTIAKIVRRYGAAARRIVQENPWALAETIDGVGFATADDIAREAGHARDSAARLQAGVRYSLDQKTAREGHCGLTRAALLEEAVKLLAVREESVDVALSQVVHEGGVVEDEGTGLLYPKGLWHAEKGLASRLRRLMDEGDRVPEDDARRAVEESLSGLGVERDESQVEAAVMAVMNPLSVITGGPGTGKSTTQKVIVGALEALGKEVVLAAPTGRAAKRLAEVSGRPASTCHRLLSFSTEKGGFEYDSSNPFPEDRLVVDEFSMVDVRLGHAFMDAVGREAGVTIVGDVDQLPSVGAGQVLRDLIESGSIPVARLKTVHRQKGNSGIVVAAARINRGAYPVEAGADDGGFQIRSEASDVSTPERLRHAVVKLMAEELPAMGFDPVQDVQVLSPMRKGDLGIAVLNEDLKAALNPGDGTNTVEMRKRIFSTGDRVMHLRNDYAKKVYNGEVGTVVWTGTRQGGNGKEEPCMKVDYSGYAAFYGPDDVSDVELAWAATVHKSQGCEFPVVIFVCPDAHRRMLTRNLFYTAVTRAKKLCVVVGHESAVSHAVATADVNRRSTGLAARMAAEPEPATPKF